MTFEGAAAACALSAADRGEALRAWRRISEAGASAPAGLRAAGVWARRRWARLLAAAVLGVVTTVALAWTAVVTVSVRGAYAGAEVVRDGRLVLLSRHGLGPGLVWYVWHPLGHLEDAGGRPARAPSWAPGWVRYGRMGLDDGQVYIYGAGWPASALRCEFRGIAPVRGANGLTLDYETRGGWPLSSRTVQTGPNARYIYPRALPWRPIWSGMALNVAVFGLAWWGLITAPAALVMWRRRQRGVCEGCGYELRGLPLPARVCPECGWERRVVGAADGA